MAEARRKSVPKKLPRLGDGGARSNQKGGVAGRKRLYQQRVAERYEEQAHQLMQQLLADCFDESLPREQRMVLREKALAKLIPNPAPQAAPDPGADPLAGMSVADKQRMLDLTLSRLAEFQS